MIKCSNEDYDKKCQVSNRNIRCHLETLSVANAKYVNSNSSRCGINKDVS